MVKTKLRIALIVTTAVAACILLFKMSTNQVSCIHRPLLG